MRKDNIFQIILLIVALLLAMFAVGCDDTKGKTIVDPALRVENMGWTYIKTISHDEHSFIIVSTNTYEGGRAIIHHPSCKCLNTR